MIKTELVGSAGQKLNLATNKKATISFAIAASQQGQASASIPLWYFDEKTALWMEEGSAIKTGNLYQGDVSHFSWWNCDLPSIMTPISGLVTDCQGVPLSNITILFNGMYTLTTNSAGAYQALWPLNMTLSAQVLATMNTGLVGNSNLIQAGPFTAGVTNILPDLIVPCSSSRLQGTLTDCNGNPVSGFVVITGSQQPTSQFCVNGVIDIPILPNVPVNIIAYVGIQSGNASAIGAQPGAAVNIGTIAVCNVNQETIVTLNGDGYNNQTFVIDTTSTNSIFIPGGPTTGLIISGSTLPQSLQCLIQIDFCGNATGNYPLGPNPTCNSDISMILNGVSYYPDDANSTNDFISVVSYGSIGENIRGTFFTHLSRIDSISGTIPITMSGTFNVPRRQ